jgi:hypothetical protein
MGRRPKSDAAVQYRIGDAVVTVATSTTQYLNAKGFIASLMARGVSPATAALYARTAARSISKGRAAQPTTIANVAELTSVRAYWRWISESYEARVRPVRRVLLLDAKQVGRLRCHAIVPPSPNKFVPRLLAYASVRLDAATKTATPIPARFDWVPTDRWTLHVPAKDVPSHQDPCIECTCLELTTEQLEVLAAAFEDAWGHRDIGRMPPEALLFGALPPDHNVPARTTSKAMSVVALTVPSPLSDALVPLQGSVTADVNAFRQRLAERRVDHVVISRAADPAGFAAVLAHYGVVDVPEGVAPSNVVQASPPIAAPPAHWPSPEEARAQRDRELSGLALTLVPPVEDSGAVPIPIAAPPPPDDWSWRKPDEGGPPVPPEVAAQMTGTWLEQTHAEFHRQFPGMKPTS